MRNGQQEADGVVGEVVFPNTVPPFFPSFVLFARRRTPEEYEHRRAGIQAHNRWLKDFCDEFPERRAGVGQIFLNDIDDAIEDATWIKEHGLRGGVLLPDDPARREVGEAALRPRVRPAVGGAARTSTSRSTSTAAPACPTTASTRRRCCSTSSRSCFYSQRPFVQLILSGVFERFPRLKFVMTENGCAWLPPLLAQLDGMIEDDPRRRRRRRDPLHRRRAHGPLLAVGGFDQNCWMGVSQPGMADAEAMRRSSGQRPVHVGQRLPPRRGHLPALPRAPPLPVPRARRRPRSTRSSPTTPPSSTTSTSTRSRRWPSRSARPSPSWPEPLPSCPRTRARASPADFDTRAL